VESKKVIKFFSYTKKILAMSFFSLILSISLSNKNLFAIDKVNLTVSNGTTYKSDNKSKVSYDLSNDKKSFSAVVGDEGETVYSRASYKDSDGKDAEAPVTSISAASGVSSFTLKLIDTKNDRITINPSEDSNLEIKLDYDGDLSQSEARKIFGNDIEVDITKGKLNGLTIKKAASSEESSEQYDYEYGSEESIASTDKTNSNSGSSSNASSSSSKTNSSSSNTSSSGSTTSTGTNSSTSKTNSSSTSTQTTKASSSSAKSSNSSKSSSSATKSASTKTSDASLIPLSILACSGASVLLFKKKD
jgi:hypothetical protein